MANHQRDPRKECFWRRHLQRWQRSRLTIRDYCAQQHLSEPSFYAWRRMLAVRDRPAAAVATPAAVERTRRAAQDTPLFVPAHLAVAVTPLELLLPGDLVVRVPAGFDADTLRRLLDTLRSQPC
jgi:hypothetical protein